jgi:hypothetical protein
MTVVSGMVDIGWGMRIADEVFQALITYVSKMHCND